MTAEEACALLLDTVWQLREARADAQQHHEMVVAALDVLRQQQEELDATRRTNQNLRDELRRYVASGVAGRRVA